MLSELCVVCIFHCFDGPQAIQAHAYGLIKQCEIHTMHDYESLHSRHRDTCKTRDPWETHTAHDCESNIFFSTADCESGKFDFAIIVDSSGSIGRRNWRLMKAFLKKLPDEFKVSPSGTQVATIAYSSKAQVVFKFNTLQGSRLNADEVKKLLDKIPHLRGLTYIDKAVQLADKEVFVVESGMRRDVTKVQFKTFT